MDNAGKLSFSTEFNQPKYTLNDSATVTIPSSGASPDTLLTVATGLTDQVRFKVFIEYAGVLYPMWQYARYVGGIDMSAGIDATFNFVVKSYNLFAAIPDVTIYYRIYIDASPL